MFEKKKEEKVLKKSKEQSSEQVANSMCFRRPYAGRGRHVRLCANKGRRGQVH